MKKIAILSNINIDPLKNHIEKDGGYNVYLGAYDQWLFELLNNSSGLYNFNPDFIFIYLNAEELKADISDLFRAIDFYSQTNSASHFIISNFSYPPYSVSTYLNSDKIKTSDFNTKLENYAASKNNISIFDFNRIITYHGYKALFDEKYWYLGRIKFSNQGFSELRKELNNLLNCIQGKTKKVLVLDLDNTLWGGIAGEDGWENLQISEEGIGKIYSDFQKNIKLLAQQGVVLATCSKNNESDIQEVFEKNRSMYLNWEDFVIHKINWEAKDKNILEISQTLNLGLDSMVFIDDNPVERELVLKNLPEVTVPDFPKDISTLNSWFVNQVIYPHFAKRNITKEDLDKSNQYKRNAARNHSERQLNYDDFIRELNIKLTIEKVSDDHFQRVAQLTQKTNQFNATVKRYTDSEIRSLAQKGYEIYTCEYEDKFGREGIIGCAIINLDKNKMIIDSFLLSCRALGRKVEFSFLDNIIKQTKHSSINKIEIFYTESPRNLMVKKFLIDFGFTSDDAGLFTKTIN